MNKQKGFAPIIILLLVAVVGALTAGAYFYGKGGLKLPATKQPAPFGAPVSATPTATNDETANWKTYTQKKANFEIKAPVEWSVTKYENTSIFGNQTVGQDPIASMELSLPNKNDKIIDESIGIYYPISIKGPHPQHLAKNFEEGLKGLETDDTEGDDKQYALKREIVYSQIDGYKALFTTYVYSKEQPKNYYEGPWCDCTSKHAYLELNNGSILEFRMHWHNSIPEVAKTIDQILSTFRFN